MFWPIKVATAVLTMLRPKGGWSHINGGMCDGEKYMKHTDKKHEYRS